MFFLKNFARKGLNLLVFPRIPTFLTDERRKKATPMTNKKHQDKTLNTSIHNLISCRLREGYIIKEIALTKG